MRLITRSANLERGKRHRQRWLLGEHECQAVERQTQLTVLIVRLLGGIRWRFWGLVAALVAGLRRS